MQKQKYAYGKFLSMNSYIVDILCGCRSGRIFRYQLEELGGTQWITPMAPFSNNSEYIIESLAVGDSYIATGTDDNSVNVWKGKKHGLKRKKKLEIHGGRSEKVRGLTFDNQYLYTGSKSGFIEIWDEKDKFKKIDEIGEFSSPITGIAINDDAIFVTTESDFSVVNKGEKSVQVIDDYDLANFPRALTMSPKYLCYSVDRYIPVYSWNPDKRALEKVVVLQNPEGMTKDLCIHENLVYSAGWNGEVRMWNIESDIMPEIIMDAQGGALESIHADSNFIYVGAHFGTLIIFDRNTREQVGTLKVKEIDGRSSALIKICARPTYFQ